MYFIYLTDKQKEQTKEIIFSSIGIIFLLIFVINNFNYIFWGEIMNSISLKNLILIICGVVLSISSGSYDLIHKMYKKPSVTLSDGARIFLIIVGFLAISIKLTLK